MKPRTIPHILRGWTWRTTLSVVFRWQVVGLAWLVVGLLTTGCGRAAKSARHLQRADEYAKAEKYEEAQLEYINALRLEPTNQVIYFRLGQSYQAQANLMRALACFLRADTNNPQVRLQLGLAEQGLGYAQDAKEAAEYVLAKQPTNAEALVLLAETTQDFADTLKRVQGLQKQATRPAAYEVALGQLYLRQTKLAAAAQSFQKAATLEPKWGKPYMGLGDVCWLSNDLNQAEQYLKKAADLDPVRSSARLKYADFKMVANNDVAGSKEVLEEIKQQAPGYLPALTRLAEIALMEKKYDECNSYLTRILSQDTYQCRCRSAGRPSEDGPGAAGQSH